MSESVLSEILVTLADLKASQQLLSQKVRQNYAHFFHISGGYQGNGRRTFIFPTVSPEGHKAKVDGRNTTPLHHHTSPLISRRHNIRPC